MGETAIITRYSCAAGAGGLGGVKSRPPVIYPACKKSAARKMAQCRPGKGYLLRYGGAGEKRVPPLFSHNSMFIPPSGGLQAVQFFRLPGRRKTGLSKVT